jgi:hypothetical protein
MGEFVLAQRSVLFYSDNDAQTKQIVDVALAAFPPDISGPLFIKLKMTARNPRQARVFEEAEVRAVRELLVRNSSMADPTPGIPTPPPSDMNKPTPTERTHHLSLSRQPTSADREPVVPRHVGVNSSSCSKGTSHLRRFFGGSHSLPTMWTAMGKTGRHRSLR